MYISKFSAFNYRSLKQISVRLENGKNVIVGKNNAGKSNIIKGLELLVGERMPTFQNLTDNDFYTYEELDLTTGELKEVISDDMYLEAEISGRDFDETMIKSIKKRSAFSKVKSIASLYEKDKNDDIKINYDFLQSLSEMEHSTEVEVLSTHRNGNEVKVLWMNSEDLLAFLKTTKTIKIFFSKSRIDDEKSGFGLICIDPGNGVWVSQFLSKKLKDALITTTVISALRSQKEDLRLVHYTWFGKLIMGLWGKSKTNMHPTLGESYETLIKAKSNDIKTLVDAVFDKDTSEIRSLLEGAISHKMVAFKFMNDSKNDFYKNVQLFINDGIDRPLHEKGTGIQSAIIISLFSLYCKNYHNNSSLLIAEEPELFLHPQARRVISAELDKFLTAEIQQPRQLIISTHSTDYLRNVDPYNIIRVHKDDKRNCSIAKQLNAETSAQITTELKRFLWSNNTELFFSDKVVLVEGGEVYLISSLVDKLNDKKQLLDYLNIAIARVNGKGSFLTYVKMLQCFGIQYLILGDLDCFKDEVPKLVKHLKIDVIKEDAEKIKTAISSLPVNHDAILDRVKGVDKNFNAQILQGLLEKLTKGEIEKDDEDLLNIIQMMQMRHTKGNKGEVILAQVGPETYNHVLNVLRAHNIFIWSKGDLETYYSPMVKALGGSKDIKALELSYRLQIETQDIEELFVYVDEIAVLVGHILSGYVQPASVDEILDEIVAAKPVLVKPAIAAE